MKDLAGRVFRALSRTAFDTEDHVGAHARHPRREGRFERFEAAIGGVESAEKGEPLRIEALYADAEAIHALRGERARLVDIERRGIAFGSHLDRGPPSPRARPLTAETTHDCIENASECLR